MLRLNITLHSSLCLAALLVPGLCPALQLSHNLPAAEVSNPPALVRFLVFDSIDAALPIEVYNFPAGQYQLSRRADRVWISAQPVDELQPQSLWVELELDGSPKGERIPLATVTTGVTFAAGNNLEDGARNLTLPEAHCSNWTSTETTGALGVFSSTETPSELTGDTVGIQPVRLGWTRLQTEIIEGVFGEAILSCASPRRLYCFQQ